MEEVGGLMHLLREGGGYALATFAGVAYWLEKKAHDNTKSAERSRLLDELNYLNRVRDGGNV